MIKAQVVDGFGTGHKLKVNGEGEANVVVHPHPPLDETVHSLPFRQYFSTDGNDTGATDMKVAGTLVAPINFYIGAKRNVDIYIRTVSILIADEGAKLSEFGHITALTNGVNFFHSTNESGAITINDALKTNWDFIRTSLDSTPVAKIDVQKDIEGKVDAYTPIMSIPNVFGLPWGLRLRKGTEDKLVFSVRDTTTGVDQFDIIGYGIQI